LRAQTASLRHIHKVAAARQAGREIFAVLYDESVWAEDRKSVDKMESLTYTKYGA